MTERLDMVTAAVAAGQRLARGRVAEATSRRVRVEGEELPGGSAVCERLHTGPEALPLAEGDRVLVWLPGDDERGVVLGRLGPSAAESAEAVPDEIVIRAGRRLTLRCGDGSISFRDDGRILIKGRELVSHARRLNRIRGGSVAIN